MESPLPLTLPGECLLENEDENTGILLTRPNGTSPSYACG